MMMELFYVLVGAQEAQGSISSVNVDAGLSINGLKKAIKEDSDDVITCNARQLKLYLAKKNDGEWLRTRGDHAKALVEGEIPDEIKQLLNGEDINPALKIRTIFADVPDEGVIHILVILPSQGIAPTGTGVESKMRTLQQDVLWYGLRGSDGLLQSINLSDPRTLSRSALTEDIINRLDNMRVLLVKSPPMTGKSSLAALVSHELVNRSEQQGKRVIVASFSLLGIGDNETFQDVFRRHCKAEWSYVKSRIEEKYTVYFVVDETQIIYKDTTDSRDSPRRKSREFWELVKDVILDQTSDIRFLMFAAYGSDLQYTHFATPVEIPPELVFGIEHLNFGPDEIQEYVRKWFVGIECLQDYLEPFCARLALLTGGHVGLCATTIRVLNEIYVSHSRRGNMRLLAQELVRMLEYEPLQINRTLGMVEDPMLFDALTRTRAVKVLEAVESEKLDVIERLVYGVGTRSDDKIIETCVRKGILVRTMNKIEFSSPVMWRFFIKMRMGHIERAVDGPKTIRHMVNRAIKAINYSNIHETLSRTLSTKIPLERAWQMEFYKASYRCTPRNFVTSVDVGGLYGSTGFIDFTIHSGDAFWGFELLREGDRLDEHIQRFAPGGRYSSIKLSDFCLIDFRRISSFDDATKATIDADLNRCDKLFVVCYDKELTHVEVFNAHSVHKILL